MIEAETLKLAEAFVRKALKTLNASASEEQIKSAAKKAAEALPPYPRRRK